MILAAYMTTFGLNAFFVFVCYRYYLKNKCSDDAWIYLLIIALYWIAYLFSSYYTHPPWEKLSFDKCLDMAILFSLWPAISVKLINCYRKYFCRSNIPSYENISGKAIFYILELYVRQFAIYDHWSRDDATWTVFANNYRHGLSLLWYNLVELNFSRSCALPSYVPSHEKDISGVLDTKALT